MTGRLHLLRQLVVGVLLGLVALSLWGVAPAHAADPAADPADNEATIDHALPSKGSVRLLVSVPGDGVVDLDGVKVNVDGKDVDSETVAASSSSVVERTSILAIDTSASMVGQAHRGGQEGRPRLPRRRACQRQGRCADLRQHGQARGSSGARP